MWPFKQKLNLWREFLVTYIVKGTAEDPGFEKERTRDALGFVQQQFTSCAGNVTSRRIQWDCIWSRSPVVPRERQVLVWEEWLSKEQGWRDEQKKTE